VVALIIIPYFNINIEAEGVWLRNKSRRLRIAMIAVGALTICLLVLRVWAILAPTVVVAGFMFLAAATPDPPGRFRRWLVSKALSFWIMTWFLIEATVLTVIGTFFRGAGWAWVWPWRS
jgi:uncharacterized membrane protein YjgN (DUF898 family)